MPEITGKHGNYQGGQIKQNKAHAGNIRPVKGFNGASKKIQGNHVEQQMGAICMHKTIADKPVKLAALHDGGWPHDQAVHHPGVAKSNERQQTGDHNEYKRMGKSETWHFGWQHGVD